MNNVKLEISDHIGIVTITRPQYLNALNYETLKELATVIEAIKNEKDLYCVIITGEGEKAFVAGADIVEMKDMDVYEARKFGAFGNKVFREIELLDMPVIAAVNGYALGGGCELALCCDIRVASDNAVFSQPETKLGVTPGFGGTQRLARIVGNSKAKELIFTAVKINAEEALRIGLVNKIVPKENLMEEVMALARQIAGNAPIAVKYCKSAINRGSNCDIDTGLQYETEVFAQCFTSEDQKNSMNAFISKTKFDQFKNK